MAITPLAITSETNPQHAAAAAAAARPMMDVVRVKT